MPKSEVAPDMVVEALALRQAGYTTLAISQRLGISVRTLQRHFAATSTKKGAIREEALQAARADLLARITNDQTIKEEAARLVADDIAHAIHLRELMLKASEHMKAANLQDVVQVMRAAAAYSTAIKNTSDIIRLSLRLERFTDHAMSELPELVIAELTADEIADLRNADEIADLRNADDVADQPCFIESDLASEDNDIVIEMPA